MFKWFTNCKTIDEVKKMYRKLAMQFHPDIIKGDGKEMKSINLEYELIFKAIEKGFTQTQKQTYNKQGHSVDDGYREMILKILHIPGIIIEICGSWVWVSGETKPVKDQLKAAGYYWAAKKLQWYWRPEQYKASKSRKSMSMDYIRDKYGSETIKSNQHMRIAQ